MGTKGDPKCSIFRYETHSEDWYDGSNEIK
jgi:hypothetical protein